MTADVEEVVKEEPHLALPSSNITGEAVGKLLAFHTVFLTWQTHVRCDFKWTTKKRNSLLCRRVSDKALYQCVETQINQNNVDDTWRCETQNSKPLRLARDINLIGPQFQC